jgi:hypothetical protein
MLFGFWCATWLISAGVGNFSWGLEDVRLSNPVAVAIGVVGGTCSVLAIFVVKALAQRQRLAAAAAAAVVTL